MKIVNNNTNQPLTQAEMEACRQFEQSDRDGQTLFHPQLRPGEPVPNCVALFDWVGRFAVTILQGRYSIQEGDWWRQETSGIQTPVENPLEAAWQAAKAVRTELKRAGFPNSYTIPVAWFPAMAEDEDILDEASGRKVRLAFGQVDLVPFLLSLPSQEELQPQLSAEYIRREVAALRRAPAKAKPEPVAESHPVDGPASGVSVHQADTVNINVYVYVTNGNGDEDGNPPLITVQGR